MQNPLQTKKPHHQKISKEDLARLHQEFDSIDTNQSGDLDLKELRAFMEKNYLQPEYADVAIKIYDEDGNGRISFDEFVKYTRALAELKDDPSIFHKLLFKALDKNHSGYLEANELMQFINYFSETKVNLDDVDAIIEQLDTNDDGKLSYEEVEKCFQ